VLTRVNITLPDGLLVETDELAQAERLTRSGLVREALAERIHGYRSPETPPLERLLRAFFAARDDVSAAWLFGSTARGEAGPLSDVDVAILPADRGLERSARLDLALEVSSRLPTALGAKQVDVVSLPDASVVLAHRVVADGKVVFGEGRRATAEAELAALTAYIDYLPVLAEADRYLAERMRSYGSL
jgi:hypothetical protein